MRRATIAGSLMLCGLMAPALFGQVSDTPENIELERLYREVRSLVKRYYPEATSHRLGNKIHFEHETRSFVLHSPDKMGRWQDPREVRGPKRGGIYADLELRPGKYLGAAVVPQTFDWYYFQAYVLAPYSQAHNVYLYVSLRYPADAPKMFVKEFADLVSHFAEYLSQRENP